MPHLLAYKNNNYRHLVRWNNSPSSAARHLGAGYITYTMTKDTYKNYIWGSYWHSGNVDKAKGFTAQQTRAGEREAAALLRSAVLNNSSTWPYQGNEWNTQNVAYPYWYHMGFCVSGYGAPEAYTESAMSVCAYHFTLPSAYRTAGLSVIAAKIKWNGLGSFVQNVARPTSQPMFYPTHVWDANNSCWGNNYKLQADTYIDAQSLAVHMIAGNTLTKANFPPSRCFFVYDNTNAHNAYEMRQLQGSFYERNGRMPTDADLLSCFKIDMTDAYNSHWKNWTWEGSRGVISNPNDRFAAHVWAMQNGGGLAYWDLYTAGSGWRLPRIGGASDYPDNRQYLMVNLDLTEAEKVALASESGVWFIVHGLPCLSRTSLTGGNYLPTSATEFEYGPWQGASNQSAVGRYFGTQVETLNDFKVEVTLG